MNYFSYDGVRSLTYGILIEENGTYNTPSRDYETIEIPGRNGDLTIDNGRYKNVDVVYKCGIGVNFKQHMNEFKAWLMSKRGYKRLEDSYHSEYFRMARVKSSPNPEVFLKGISGHFDVIFDCKPQRFLKSGETEQTFTASGSITNPTLYEALPLIRVYGTGALAIGGNTITINSANSYTDLDCDIQDAFKGAVNCNGNITLNSGKFFTLKPGNNGITLGSGISKIILTPRWWTL